MSATQELTDITKTWIDLASEIYGRRFIMPEISLNLKGACAGQASFSCWLVKYNFELYMQNKVDFINRTVPHEIAHLIARTVYGMWIKSHGVEWQSVMRKFGIEPKRCHSYDLTGIKKGRSRPYVYTCGCREYNITSLLHNRMQKGSHRKCLRCGGRLQFKEVRFEVAA